MDVPARGNIISTEDVVIGRPDVIICGKSLAEKVRHLPGWAQAVPAVIHNRFFLDEATLVRPTPRLVTAMEALARYLHPELDPHAF